VPPEQDPEEAVVLIVGGTFQVDPDQRERFLAGRHDMMRTSRAEPGCLEYTFSADPIEPSRVVLFERWESQDALDVHLAALRTPSPSSGDSVAPKSASIVIYEVSGERSLGR
jgi:quinol monooxygenase YgiN